MSARPGIATLRELVRRIESPSAATRAAWSTGLPRLDARLPGGGLSPGAVLELRGADELHGAWRLAAHLLARATAEGQAALIDPGRQLYGPAAAALGIDLRRLLIIHPPNPKLGAWAVEEVARCPGLRLTVALAPPARLTTLRRWQLAAEEGGGVLALLREGVPRAGCPGLGASIRLDLAVTPDPQAEPWERRRRLSITVARGRGRQAFDPFEVELDGATGALPAPPLLRG